MRLRLCAAFFPSILRGFTAIEGTDVRTNNRHRLSWWRFNWGECLRAINRYRLRCCVRGICWFRLYIATAADLSAPRRMAYFACVLYRWSSVLRAGRFLLSDLTGYNDKPLDAIGAVIISALAVKNTTFLNNQDIGSLVALITRRGGSGGTK